MSPPTQQELATSDEQQGKINEVRELLGDMSTEMPSFLSNATIRRFLGARNWSTAQAVKTLKETAKWRRQYQPEKIRWEDIVDVENEAKRAYIPDYLDKKGRTVFVTLPATKSNVSEKEQIKYLVYILENLVLDTENAQEENVVWISDFQGWAISSTSFSLSKESLHIIQKYYPGMIAVAIVTNAPRIFESFWKIIKHFLEPKMKEKVKFVHTNNLESVKIMAEMFDMDKLESTFGGKSTAGVDIVKYAERVKTRDHIRGTWKPDNGGLISEIRELAHLKLLEFRVNFVPRNCNKVAHAMAALGCVCASGDNPILDVLPDCILKLVADDLAVLE